MEVGWEWESREVEEGKPRKRDSLSPYAFKSSQESTQKIVTVSFRNCALSGKNTLALFFFSQLEMNYGKSQKVWGQMEVSPLHIGTHGYGPRTDNTQAHADWGFLIWC